MPLSSCLQYIHILSSHNHAICKQTYNQDLAWTLEISHLVPSKSYDGTKWWNSSQAYPKHELGTTTHCVLIETSFRLWYRYEALNTASQYACKRLGHAQEQGFALTMNKPWRDPISPSVWSSRVHMPRTQVRWVSLILIANLTKVCLPDRLHTICNLP